LRRRAGAPPALASGDGAQAASPGGAAGRRRGLRRVGGDGPARGPERRAPPRRPGAACAAAHDRARLAPRLRHPAWQEGLPAHERELRPLPAARARAAGPRQEARHGRAGARRDDALAGERAPGRGAGGLPVGGGSPAAAVAAVIDLGRNSAPPAAVAGGRGRARGPRARRPAGRLRGALAMTADELARAIDASGVRDTARVAEAARAVAGWLAHAPADEVVEGLAAAADPAAALDQLARLLPAAEAPPAPGPVPSLLRLLG